MLDIFLKQPKIRLNVSLLMLYCGKLMLNKKQIAMPI